MDRRDGRPRERQLWRVTTAPIAADVSTGTTNFRKIVIDNPGPAARPLARAETIGVIDDAAMHPRLDLDSTSTPIRPIKGKGQPHLRGPSPCPAPMADHSFTESYLKQPRSY